MLVFHGYDFDAIHGTLASEIALLKDVHFVTKFRDSKLQNKLRSVHVTKKQDCLKRQRFLGVHSVFPGRRVYVQST